MAGLMQQGEATGVNGWSLGAMVASGVIALELNLLPPALAHQVKAGADVGVTLHIEPNDIPQAGVATPVWFALTQRGGAVIPLADCDCRLTLYDGQNQAIAVPPLTPTTAETYTAIPGTEITFPTVGTYTLVLTGTPQGEADFAPFEFRFPVLVASAAAPPEPTPVPGTVPGEPMTTSSPSEAIAASQNPTPQSSWIGWAGVALAVGLGGSVYRQYQRSRQARE